MLGGAQQPSRAVLRAIDGGLWGLAIRGYRVAVLGAAVFFALVGAMVAPPYVGLLIAPVCGMSAAGVVALVHPDFPEARSARRAVVFCGAGAALLVPAVPGIGASGTAGMVVVLILMLAGWIVVGGVARRLTEPAARGAERGLDEEELRAFVRVLPVAMLLDEWRATGDDLVTGAAPARRAEAALTRRVLLEEFSRRDPAGVARWLSDGDQGSPEHYIRGDSDATR